MKVLVSLFFLVSAGSIAGCAAGPSPGARDRPRGRACVRLAEYPADTTLDFHSPPYPSTLRSGRGSTAPRYPSDLRQQGVEGNVRASFVIDTTGQVLIHTAIITEESHFSFGSAVCAWLAREARFEPFVVAGRRYSVRVTNYPFQFSLGPF